MDKAEIDYLERHSLFLTKKKEKQDIYIEKNTHTQRKLCGYQLIGIHTHKQPLHK